ncbi:MAG: rRNA pseudouridine synthase [Saprospiraceae bacterium]|nr:rRNA pseudouridine synthase [Saprospiraceae bacterium]
MADNKKSSGKTGSSKNLKPKKHGDFSKFIDEQKRRSRKTQKPKVVDEIWESRSKPKPRAIKEERFAKEPIRLNKYIANAGICSRRDADELIKNGEIKVNNIVVTELGTKVNPGDKVQYGKEILKGEELRYVLLNKPKGFVTTMDDPQGRKTVMSLVEKACEERIYPVGRLDMQTTGLLLFTNDGELAKKLTHPKHRSKKIYHVGLNKDLTKNDYEQLILGVELDDGPVKLDAVAYIEDSKREIGIELHSGRNRIVRRIFESLGYDVVKLDRVAFAGLTKKNVPRGKWRVLNEQEVNFLKMIK